MLRFLALLIAAFISGSFSIAHADQTVPVPGDIQEPVATSITVIGQPGASQADATVRIVHLYLGSDGLMARATGSTSPAYELGQQVAVEPGQYMVSYSGSSISVEIAKNEHRQIELKKLTVPKIDGSYKVEVFPDFADRDQQIQRVLFTWLTPQPLVFNCYSYNDWGRVTDTWTVKKSIETACGKSKNLKPLGRRYCSSYTSSNYQNLIENFFKFKPDATYSTAEVNFSYDCGDGSIGEASEKMLELGRITIAHGVDGDFVSLMPGVYGTKITSHSGKTSIHQGIRL